MSVCDVCRAVGRTEENETDMSPYIRGSVVPSEVGFGRRRSPCFDRRLGGVARRCTAWLRRVIETAFSQSVLHRYCVPRTAYIGSTADSSFQGSSTFIDPKMRSSFGVVLLWGYNARQMML